MSETRPESTITIKTEPPDAGPTAFMTALVSSGPRRCVGRSLAASSRRRQWGRVHTTSPDSGAAGRRSCVAVPSVLGFGFVSTRPSLPANFGHGDY